MKSLLGQVKWTVAAAAISVFAVAGMPTQASALGFNFGDLGFFVYGGDNERYENFGTGSTVPTMEGSSPTTRNISGDLSTLNTGATVGLRYALLGTSTDGQFMYFSTPAPAITSTMNNSTNAANAAGEFLFWAGQHATATGGLANPLANNPSITSKAAVYSYTNFLTNTGTVNGQFVGFTSHGTLDQLLNVFKVNIDGEAQVFTRVATAVLTAGGQLTITPEAVPVPAAVILFGTGLVGLAGVARRSFNRTV